LALRAGFGVARTGGVGEHSSGDLVLAFATGNDGLSVGESQEVSAAAIPLEMFPDTHINDLFDAVIEATEEAILNSLFRATTVTGVEGNTVEALPVDQVRELLAAAGMLGDRE
jgi:D-aminopeptidase